MERARGLGMVTYMLRLDGRGIRNGLGKAAII